MAILAGTYVIHSTPVDLVLDWANYRSIEGHPPHKEGNQRACASGYAVSNQGH